MLVFMVFLKLYCFYRAHKGTWLWKKKFDGREKKNQCFHAKLLRSQFALSGKTFTFSPEKLDVRWQNDLRSSKNLCICKTFELFASERKSFSRER